MTLFFTGYFPRFLYRSLLVFSTFHPFPGISENTKRQIRGLVAADGEQVLVIWTQEKTQPGSVSGEDVPVFLVLKNI